MTNVLISIPPVSRLNQENIDFSENDGDPRNIDDVISFFNMRSEVRTRTGDGRALRRF